MDVTIFQAILIGILSYLGTLMSPWLLGCTGGWYTIGRPLVSGMLIGLILGDVRTGILVGAAVQTVFIAMVTPGGAMPTDLNAAVFIGVGLSVVAVKDGATVEAATSIATACGAAGIILHNGIAVFNSIFNERALQAVSTDNEKQFLRNHWVWPQIALLISRAVPTFLTLYYGQGVATWIIQTFPSDSYIMRVLSCLGGLLPAIGVGLLVKGLVKKPSDLLAVLLGFTLVAALSVNMISLTIIAGFFAYQKFASDSKQAIVAGVSVDDDDMDEVL